MRKGARASQSPTRSITTTPTHAQPRSSIFKLFDDVVLLSDGGVAYAGPAATMTDYFASLGHACPKVKSIGGEQRGEGGHASVACGRQRVGKQCSACTQSIHPSIYVFGARSPPFFAQTQTQNFNPAEFALDLVSVDYSSRESEEAARARVQKLLGAHRCVCISE